MSTFDFSLDFKRLKAQVSIGQVLHAYGLDTGLRRRENQLIGPCPLHGGDHPTAFRVQLDRGIWHCFTACAAGGDVVDLIRRIKPCDDAQAAKILRSISLDLDVAYPIRTYDASPPISSFRPFCRRISLDPKADFLQQQKGINVDTATLFETGLPKYSRFLQGTVALRLYDVQGRPLGYCGRRLDPKDIARFGKWRFPERFPKKTTLYNAHRATSFRRYGIVVVECPWSVMRFAQAGFKGAVALLGTQLSSLHCDWLAQARAVLVMLDGDAAGRKATKQIVTQLSYVTQALAYHLSDGLEPEDLTDSHLYALAQRYLSSS